MNEALPTVPEVAAHARIPPERWAGNCHVISTVVAALVEGAVVRRGYFLGETTRGAMFHRRNFQQHSWVELPDGTVVDPTRHAFTGGEPQLWTGPADDYDIGGCRTQAPLGPAPDFYDDTDRDPVLLEAGCIDYLAELLGTEPVLRSEGNEWLLVSVEQVFWLGNLPIKDAEAPGVLSRFFAAEVYEAIIRAGHGETIPIDRRDWILGGH